jgi:ATP-dependent Clp protease ATP-binding subunit ClpX
MAAITCIFCGNGKKNSHKLLRINGNVICDNCINMFYNVITTKQELENKSNFKLNSHDLHKYLDQYVIGQEDAKVALCVAVSNHYKRMNDKSGTVNKSNLIIAGPSGSGKTLLVSNIAKCLQVPFVAIDTPSLTEAGYIGQNVDTIITRLLLAADGDIEKAEHGIIFLDEIDKIANKKRDNGSSGSNIQPSLLKILEGTVVSISVGPRGIGESVDIDTKNILFIAGGAFLGMDKIVEARKKHDSHMGFNSKIPALSKKFLDEVTTDDLIEFGFIPEFIGRFPLKTYTNELQDSELEQVLLTAKNNVLDDYKFYFNMDKIEVSFTPDFIHETVSRAIHQKTGVRGLRSIIDGMMLSHLYNIPSYQKDKVSKVIFNKDCITNNATPILEFASIDKKKKLI